MAASTIQRERIAASVGVGLLHALLGYAFITGLGSDFVRKASEGMKIFDVRLTPPPPPIEEPIPAVRASDELEGAASARNLRAQPSPVVAPPPKIRLEVPSPVVAAPLPIPVPPGSDTSAGASDKAGPGFGGGGVGSGPGSGSAGYGRGGGGIATRARRQSGRLSNDDYPRAALRAGVEGAVSVRYSVGTNGRVTGCRVTRSSGHAELDATTCRLIEARFRYRPARDAQGTALVEVKTTIFDWLLPLGRQRP